MKYLALVTLVGLFILTSLSASLSAPVMAQSGLTVDVDAGFDSFAKSDLALPIRVTIANQGPALEAELQVRSEDSWAKESIFSVSLQLPQQSRKQIPINTPLQNTRRIKVHLVGAQGELLLQKSVSPQHLSAEDVLVGVVASDGSLLNGMAGIKSALGGRIAVAHLGIQDLPETIQGWAALDLLVFNDVDTSQLTTPQRDVLSYWAHSGGKLLVGGGPNADQTLAGLSALIPMTEVEEVTLPHPLEDLDTFSQLQLIDQGPYVAALPVGLGGTNALVEAKLTQGDSSQNSSRRSLEQQKRVPIISSWGIGAGSISYVAFDLSLAPMNQVSGEESFLTQLLGPFEARPKSYLVPSDQANFGYGNGLRTSLALIPGSSLPSPLTVGMYLLIYVLAVGPLNYFILGRYKKRAWTWVTLPLIVLLFCGIGYVRGFQLSGRQTIVRQITVLHAQGRNSQLQNQNGTPLSLVQGVSPLRLNPPDSSPDGSTDASTPQVTSSLAEYGSFIGIFSPTRTGYQVELGDARLVQPLDGGYNADALNVSYGNPTKVIDLRADIGSMPTVLARGQLPAPAVSAELTFDNQSRKVHGTIINNTGKPILGAYLVFKEYGLDLDMLQPGETYVDSKISLALARNDMYSRNQPIALPSSGYPGPSFLGSAANAADVESLKWSSRELAVKSILLLNANQQYNGGLPTVDRPTALHLIGWQDDSPVDVSLASYGSRSIKETLLLIRLN